MERAAAVAITVAGTRSAQLRCRSKFENWKLKFNIELLDEDLDPKIVKAVLVSAGHKVGIGDNRLNGFGRFEVVKFEPHSYASPDLAAKQS